jgi:hypothetical protein
MLGQVTSFLLGGQRDPETGAPIKQPPGQLFRSLVAGALLGGAIGSEGKAGGGTTGGFIGGLARGGAGVEQQQYERQQQQFKNQLAAQQNQREQQQANRENQAFQTEQTHRQAMIAAENMQTIRTQQLIKGDTLKQFQEEAANGKSKVQPYIDSGIEPSIKDKTWQEVSAITSANPKAVGLDWEQTGVKTVINPDGTTGYVPTFDAYDADRTVTLSKSFLDLMKKAKVDDVYPGTTERLKVGQQLKPAEFAAIKAQYQKVYNDNLVMEKARLEAGNLTAREKLEQAQALKAAADAARANKTEKSAQLLGDALDEWNKAGPGPEGFAKLKPKAQFAITTNLVKTIDSLEKQIKDALNPLDPDEDRANELKEQQEGYRNLQRMTIAPSRPTAPANQPGPGRATPAPAPAPALPRKNDTQVHAGFTYTFNGTQWVKGKPAPAAPAPAGQ